MTFVYLARPVDFAHSANQTLKRYESQVLSSGLEAGVSFFQPARAYVLAVDDEDSPLPAHMRILDEINQRALFECEGLVAILVDGLMTLGVPSEIEMALRMNKPTIIVTTASIMATSIQVAQWTRRGAQVVMGSGPQDMIPLGKMLQRVPVSWFSGEWEPRPPFPTLPDLLIQRIHPDAKIPDRAYPDDAGLDLATVIEAMLAPGDSRMIPTGIKAAVPTGWWGYMKARSSARLRWGLQIHDAVIDSGYRGELMIGVTNPNSYQVNVPAGTRLAQYVLQPAYLGSVIEVDELPAAARGESGYGSSGH